MTTIHQPQQKQQESLPSANVDTTSTANSIIIHLSNKEETRNNNKTVTPTTITTSKLTSDIIPSNLIPVSTITINIDNNNNDDSIIYDPLALASLVSSLNKDGSGKIILTFSSTATGSDSTLISSIHTSIVLAGLIAQSEKITENGIGCITAVYKNNVNTTRNGNKSSSQPLKINLSAASNISNNNNNGGDNDDELIDEDELLSSNINYNNPTDIDVTKRQKELNDCGGRKACDNCTCGRKEMEAMESGNGSVITSTAKEKVNLKSSCGNCAKGDAFRCAGCPFLGKPAFKEGEEHLVLDLTDDL